MENQFKSTYDRITIDDGRRAEMEAVIGKAKNKSKAKIGAAAIATAAVVGLMVIPTTRTQIVNAASMIIRVFTANGQEITVEQLPNESVVSVDYDENKDYTLVQDGRLYLVVGDTKIDVTDQCSYTEYYRYEIVNSDGSRNVIFVGGTVENPGWIELIFDSAGNYVTNHMNIKDSGNSVDDDPNAWFNRSMHNEGVPCGVWELDKELYE
ncbi:MAG: hypothetical protein Q4C15_13550 [Eubacteriales bacterium]|nr:hypothetical protein [Eubacteriales bacterium]